ncbi:neutrophilic granule protein-like [Lithobates pipiens]
MNYRTMGNYFQICVLLQAMTVLYSASIYHPLRRPPNPQLLEDSIELFNEGLNNSSFLYKLLQVDSHSQADFHENNSLSFVIKETVCRKAAEIPEECPFKEDGVMKNCTAVYSRPRQDKAELSCQTLDPPVSSLQPATSEGGDKIKSSQSHPKAKFINSGKKNEKTFQDDIKLHNIGGSCLECIFDPLPNSQNTIRSSVFYVFLLYILLQLVM